MKVGTYLQGKDYWNIITQNAKRVTTRPKFRRWYAYDPLRDIDRIFIFLYDVY